MILKRTGLQRVAMPRAPERGPDSRDRSAESATFRCNRSSGGAVSFAPGSARAVGDANLSAECVTPRALLPYAPSGSLPSRQPSPSCISPVVACHPALQQAPGLWLHPCALAAESRLGTAHFVLVSPSLLAVPSGHRARPRARLSHPRAGSSDPRPAPKRVPQTETTAPPGGHQLPKAAQPISRLSSPWSEGGWDFPPGGSEESAAGFTPVKEGENGSA